MVRGRWQLKVAIQFLLAHFPGGEAVNNAMQRWNGSFSEADARSRVLGLTRFLHANLDPDGKAIVEIGTGWDAINPLMLSLFGARIVYTYDHVRHLRFDLAMNVVRQIKNVLPQIVEISGADAAELELRLQQLLATRSLDELLKAARIVYVAPGDGAETGLPAHSVDVVYSYAVFEHVPESVIAAITDEARRVLVPGGLALHHIGLHDHYIHVDGSISKVNFLQYPEWAWNLFVQNKISYHNRMREPQFLKIFAEHGARVQKKTSDMDPADLEAVKRMRVDSRFAAFTPEELAVTRLTVALTYA